VKSTNTNPLARPDQMQVAWIPTRPDLVIRTIGGGTTRRCYSETMYEVVSRHALTPDDFVRLDACRLLGLGQAYDVVTSEVFTEDAPPITIDRRTGAALPDVAPVSWDGKPVTQSHPYEYHRYVVRRICDSGD
jgi:hypothetical protein